jgi:hypothetical protein
MAKTVVIKPKATQSSTTRNFKRMDLAAQSYGVSVALLKKLMNQGRLTRYKLGAATMIDTIELEKLIVVDAGNHGPEAAPKASLA